MDSRRNSVTMRDVAKKAGVSVATVSRVLNDSNLVVAKTEKKIRKIAHELNYIPSATARSLSIRRTETIGLLLPDMYGDFFSEIIRGADLAARNAGYHLIVSSSHSNTEELDAAVRTLSGRVDGMIIMSPHLESSKHLHGIVKAMPTVIIGPSGDFGEASYLTIDNVGGAMQIVQHLLKQGHRRIMIIRGEKGNQDAEERLQGYVDTMMAAGIRITNDEVILGDFTEQSGYDATGILLDRAVMPTAIFASNDSMAIGALRCLREKNVPVPGQIAVAGFDDILISRYVRPSLTTVHVDTSQLGILAIKNLLDSFAGVHTSHENQRHTLPAKLIVRESTAARNSFP
jgi:LacI family transcriptional regulator